MSHTKEYRAAWYAKNKEHCRAYRKKWKAENPDKMAKYLAKSPRQHKARRDKFRDTVNQIKAVPCKDCGNSYPPRVMEFDHVSPGEKRFTISRMVGKSTSFAQQRRILEEIKKCEVVCANCHRLREIKRDEDIAVRVG